MCQEILDELVKARDIVAEYDEDIASDIEALMYTIYMSHQPYSAPI